MDETRRNALLEKRRLLRLRHARRDVSASFRRVACGLRREGVRCAKLMPEACRHALGTLASGPGRDERLDWTVIRNGSCRTWTSDEERNRLVASALAACTRPEARVAVVWSPFSAGLRIGADDLARHADAILDEATEIWIVAADGGPWLIEVSHWDREVCHTRSMPLFVDSRFGNC
jgi:hypothetical protein